MNFMTLSTNFQGKYLHLSTQTVYIKFQNYFIKKQYLIESLHDFQMDKLYLCTQILRKKLETIPQKSDFLLH